MFKQALADVGLVDGQTCRLEWRGAAGKVENIPAAAAELVRIKVDVIVASSTPVVQSAKNITTSIPIIMSGVADPVGIGFVESLARPGGNITGLSLQSPELAGKRLELLSDIAPKLSRVAFLAYGPDPAHRLFVKEAQDAATRMNLQMLPLVVEAIDEIDNVLSGIVQQRAGALIVQPLFILAACTLLAVFSQSTEAQPPQKAWKVGFLIASSAKSQAVRLDAFKVGLRKLGYIDGQNINLFVRSGEGKADQLQLAAAELVSLRLDVIVSGGPTSTRALKAATRRIPIITTLEGDPIGAGLITSLARPGGNITGLSTLGPELSGKRLEILKAMVPGLSRVAVLESADTRRTTPSNEVDEKLSL